ncbi:hypothetical protein MPH_02374 [Macrophomina phaseolina MS6]|uniref:Uncharacterized protein n=2 Tax=Macrophomina phaseolina TaxID=35725 RepID=K2S5G4_MACPH|nr:hypothetical protein MPH_02374 [Macrophomina phaseolina MS6]KAH7041914.1 hypothetical protein B0J12DRAFT_702582 [Macrophomina phaseolina]
MSTAADVQALLRFLSKDAKLPLATAISKVKELQQAELGSPHSISKSTLQDLQKVFSDEKLAKQVFNAAKRLSKKRTSSVLEDAPSISAAKKSRTPATEPGTPAALEESLELPTPCLDEGTIRTAVVITNRAPLVLAFAVQLLKYTMPEQPLSSRLSLAQAVVSVNSRSKAVNIGLESGKSAEDEGWGEGQPIVRIMGREIRVMKRWGYEWEKQGSDKDASASDSQQPVQGNAQPLYEQEPPLWGLDLEALRRKNGPSHHAHSAVGGLPIYTAQSARSYLLRSFDSVPAKEEKKPAKKQSGVSKQGEKDRNLGMLLGALDLLYQSWAQTLEKQELDKRAWGWYVAVRPEVATGAAGWGEKSQVKLSKILDLRR